MSDPTIELLRRLDPTAGDDPAKAVGADSRAELLTRIMQADPADTEGSPRRRFLVRRVVPALVAAGIATAITFSVVGLPDRDRHEALGQALSFTDEGNFLRVKIVDPKADSARYNAEFKKRHLDITLELVPASPSVVGKEVAAGFGADSENIRSTGDPEGCVEAGSYPCVPTFLVPKDYTGSADLQIGRAAAPGEHIDAGGAIDGHGEALEGVKYLNQTVAMVLAILAERGYTVPEYRYTKNNFTTSPKTVPTTWFVRSGFLVSGKEVILFVSPKR
jgi:hypothetical protein